MTDLPHILGESTGYEKLIGLLIFAAIWGISALASWINKQKKQQEDGGQRQGIAQRFPEVRRPPDIALPRPIAPRGAQRVAPPVLPKVHPTARRHVARPAAVATPPPIVQSVAPAMELRDKPKRPQATSATAVTIAAWLRPHTMRQQFLLTEILQPPLALRDRQL